jgi:fatty acid desaturase
MPHRRTFDALAERLINDPRDLPFFWMTVKASALLPLAAALLVRFSWALAAIYIVLYVAVLLPPFVTMYHDTTHNRLFRRRYEGLNLYLDWVVAPLFGFTPETYFAHHIGMHHPEENLAADVSTTLPYRRDSVRDFARYYVRFFFCIGDLVRYFRAKRRTRLLRRLVIGEIVYFAAFAAAVAWSPRAAIFVFALPLFIGRSVLILGNWGEHVFVDPAQPENLYRASTNLLGDSVNRRCFNVGYHLGHHLRPRMHFTEMPAEFESRKEVYGREDALAFRDMHYPTLTFLVLAKRYRTLARAYVALPGAPERTEDELIALFRSRVAPVFAGAAE